MSTVKSIVLVCSSLGAGGAERVLTTLANAWVERGVAVHVIILSQFDPFYSMDGRIKVTALNLSIPARHLIHAFWLNLCRAIALRRAVKSTKAVTVLSFGTETNIVTIVATIGLQCRIVVSERCDPRFYPKSRVWRALRRAVYPFANTVVVQTRTATASLSPWLKDKTVVIPNPVISPRAAGWALNIPNPFVLAVGRFVRQKGFDLLIEAFARVAQEFPRWRLVVLGSGEERASLDAQVKALKLDDKIEFAGVVGSPGDFMARADVFVLPSRFEGFPNVLGEAMASGVSVIAADCPSGPADIVRNDVDGLLVPPEDIASLASAMRELMQDQVRRQRLGKEARAITERFSLERVVTAWEATLVPERRTGTDSERRDKDAEARHPEPVPESSFSLAANLGGRGFLLLVISLVGVGLAYASHIIVARLLGVDGYGVYAFILAIGGIATLASQLGFDSLLTRMVPVYDHTADERRLKRLLMAGVLSTSAIIVLLAPILPLASTFRPGGSSALPIAILALALLLILAQSWGNLLSSALIGAHRQVLAKFLSEAARPGLFLVIVTALWFGTSGSDVTEILLANIAVVLLVGTIAGTIVWHVLRLNAASGWGISIAEYRGWLATSLPMLLFFLPQSLIINVDIMLLGVLAGTDSSGLYWAAARTATLVAFPLYAMNTLIAPMISKRFIAGVSLNSLLRSATLCALPAALIALMVLLVFGDWIMRFFGPEFQQSVHALWILAGGYVLLTLLGPIDFALTMTNHEGKCAVVMLLGSGLNVLLNLALIPRFGMEGAAVATVVSLTLTRSALVFLARHYLDVWIYPFLKLAAVHRKD